MSSPDLPADMIAKASLHLRNARPLVPMYIHLILSALFPIYAGAHASLSRPVSAAKPKKKTKRTGDLEDEDEDKIQKMEGLSSTDAIILPITAGLTLAGLYFLIMKYGADVVNLIMGYYFAAVGVFSVAQFVQSASNTVVGFIFPSHYRYRGSLYTILGKERTAIRQDGNEAAPESAESPLPDALGHLGLPQWLNSSLWAVRNGLKQKYTFKAYVHTIIDLSLNLTIINLFSGFVGLGTVIYVNTVSKPWFLTNLQGFAVSYYTLQLLSPTTFATGSLILSALFFYDIWAVFFTPLMVAVASNLDQPIKLVFPRPDEPSEVPGKPPTQTFSMLGLGDVVIPGIMIGLALRFDLYMFYLRKQKKSRKSTGDASSRNATMQKAAYVSVSGKWGDRFWTSGLPSSSLPDQLRTSFPKRYFTASIIGYVIGMLTTLFVMTVFRHAQPALLYLVPGVLISLWGTALARGELKEMWEFSEAVNAEQIESGDSDEASKKEGDEKRPLGLFERLWRSSDSSAKDEQSSEPREKASLESSSAKKEEKKVEAKKPKHGLLFSFSISRYTPKPSTTSKSRQSQSASKATDETKESLVGTEDLDDAVLVSSAELQSSPATSPYRTRSAAATASFRR